MLHKSFDLLIYFFFLYLFAFVILLLTLYQCDLDFGYSLLIEVDFRGYECEACRSEFSDQPLDFFFCAEGAFSAFQDHD